MSGDGRIPLGQVVGLDVAFPASGLEADRPTSGLPIPAFYSATDTGVVYRSEDRGATWAVWALALPEGTADGDVPAWDDSAGLWVPGAPGGGGGAVSDSGWQAMPLASGIVSHADNFGSPPRIRKLDNFVYLTGVIRRSSGSFSQTVVVVANLGVGYRPTAVAGTVAAGGTIAAVYGAGAASGPIAGRWELNANGELRVATSSTSSWFGFAGGFFTD